MTPRLLVKALAGLFCVRSCPTGGLVVLLAALHSPFVVAQIPTEPGLVFAQLSTSADSAVGLFNIHIDDVRAIDAPGEEVTQLLQSLPQIEGCTIQETLAQNNFKTPPQPVRDYNLWDITDEVIAVNVFWTCDKTPKQIDAQAIFDRMNSIQNVFISTAGEEMSEMAELILELRPGSSNGALTEPQPNGINQSEAPTLLRNP